MSDAALAPVRFEQQRLLEKVVFLAQSGDQLADDVLLDFTRSVIYHPDGDPILTLAGARWYGPKTTWPSLLENYPYIEFWHQLDTALEAENIPGMGPELLGDDAWGALFDDAWGALFDGRVLAENSGIRFFIWTVSYDAQLTALDQVGTARPANSLGDIGAIEYLPPDPEQLPDVDTDGDGIHDLLDMDDDNDGQSRRLTYAASTVTFTVGVHSWERRL